MEEPQKKAARLDSEHYREMARKLRQLAREFRFPGARRELLDLAERYERRADNLDARSAAASHQDQH
jgi:ADP-heptose:LPS heptosyltransferase